jgi:adenylyl-sulfate kinase
MTTSKTSKLFNTPRNVMRHMGSVSLRQRSQMMRQTPVTVWFTGLSGSGKSTMAYALEAALSRLGRASYVLDGDNVRHGLNRDLGFSREDRAENIRRLAEVSHLMNEAGLIVLASSISPYRADREQARQIVGPDRFLEIHVSTSLEECERRDTKGLYQRARRGEIPEFTGISAPYEAPLAPALAIDTTLIDVNEAAEILLQRLSPYLWRPSSVVGRSVADAA